jgi:hypothetical protein
MQTSNTGIAWEASRTKRVAILLIAVAMAVLLVVSFMPNAQAADSLQLADGDTTVVVWGYPSSYSYPGGYSYPSYPSFGSSMRGVSWS